MSTLAAIPIWDDVDVDRFRAEIAPQNRPAVLRGLVGRWPAVQEGMRSPQAFIDYLLRFDAGHPIRALRADPSIKGGLTHWDTHRFIDELSSTYLLDARLAACRL